MPYEYTRETTICESECFLIKRGKTTDENGVLKDEIIYKKPCFCTVSSLYMRDTYAAFQAGIKPAWKLSIFYGDYDNELTVEFEGIEYDVYRTYVDGDTIELYLRRDAGTWQAELT